jgi:hypothetical protein
MSRAEARVTLTVADADLIRMVAQYGLTTWPRVTRRQEALDALVRLGELIQEAWEGLHLGKHSAWRKYYATNMLAQTDYDISGDAFGAGWNAAMVEALADADSVAARIAEAYTGGWNAHKAAMEAYAEKCRKAGIGDMANTIKWAVQEVERGSED